MCVSAQCSLMRLVVAALTVLVRSVVRVRLCVALRISVAMTQCISVRVLLCWPR